MRNDGGTIQTDDHHGSNEDHHEHRAEWECDSRPDALIRPLAEEFTGFQTLCGPWQRRVQTGYDFAEKSRGSLRFNCQSLTRK
jgi:hypothetical protein